MRPFLFALGVLCASCNASPPNATTAPPSVAAPAPYTSVSTLPPHRAKVWELFVGDRHGHVLYQVADIRAGDVPLPAGLPWRCRFNHLEVIQDVNERATSRMLACSSDGWKTFAAAAADYESSGQLDLHQGPASDRSIIFLTLTAQDRSPAPELP